MKITEEKALQDAAAIDARGINPDVVTDGISIAVKDNIVTEGIETTAASKILGGWIPPYNATVANKLSESGLITIGKLNMDEFAMGGSGENSSVKPTKNAWDQNKSTWWFFIWFCGFSCFWSSSFIIGFRYWWLNSPTCRIQWDCWFETNLWSCESFWFNCFLLHH